MSAPPRILYLSGGVGGARLLAGLARVVPPETITALVNTGDDFRHWGLHIAPDLDTVMYTLAGLSHEERGWGLAEESFAALDMVRRYGGDGWFALGDRDLATDVPVVSPHDVLVLRLHWRVNDWLTPERLDSSPIVMSQQNDRLSYSTMPLAGLQGWPRAAPPGHVIVDRQQISLDPSAVGGQYPVTVRVFDPATASYLRALTDADGPLTDVITVGLIKVVVPTSSEVTQARPAALGDVARFIGYNLSVNDHVVHPGDTVTLTVVYQALRPADRGLTQFTHLYDAARGLIGQSDSPPLAGNNPAPGWVSGEIIRDVLEIEVAGDAPPGDYALLWGLYDPATGERLPITLPDGTQPTDRALLLETLQVVAP